ncbi:MAG: mycothiol transferase [Acidimicrobiia bacterium]
MKSRELLSDAFTRISESVNVAVENLSRDEAAYRPDPDANSIAWLVWHLTRVQDDHVAEIAGHEQEWLSGGWNTRFGTDPAADNTGYGHTSEQVAGVMPDELASLGGYHEAVLGRTLEYLAGVDVDELDRIVDDSYDPPVSVGVRLVSVISDNIQHAGQARYVRGIVERVLPG